jgi:hypothetical protein
MLKCLNSTSSRSDTISSLIKGFAVKVGEIATIKHTVAEPESGCESESNAEDSITESISPEMTLESDSQ